LPLNQQKSATRNLLATDQKVRPMDDPIQRHPTRAEQLDILTDLIAETTQAGDPVLDLGCGTGYLQHLLAEKRRDLAITGVDMNETSLAAAEERFAGKGDYTWVRGDLRDLAAIDLPRRDYKIAVTCLTFHDLSDPEKQATIAWIADHIAEDGVILLMDRIRLTKPSLFPMQVALWKRLERVHGFGMRSADTFDAYIEDFASNNSPGRTDDYRAWFKAAGLTSQVLHLHGNIMITAAARPSTAGVESGSATHW
jgi:tRNA (cmo5U34)-methyltransferase